MSKKEIERLEAIVMVAFWEKLHLEDDIREKQINLLGVTSKIKRIEYKIKLLRGKP